MKKLSTIIMALALVLGMSQCKKQETPTNGNGGEKVYVTLNVSNGESIAVNVDNGGSRHEVAPTLGVIRFENGDKLHVGYNGQYIGQLTYQNGAFGGELNGPTNNVQDHLHFYFLGGKGINENSPAVGDDSFTFSIADQSAKLPVLCYGASTQIYGKSSNYTAVLEYKCALVRFDLENHGENYSVTLNNVPTQATVNFASPTATTAIVATANQTNADMTLYGEPGNAAYRWAILLPGTNLSTEQHSDLTITYSGEADLTNLDNNNYINGGISISNPRPVALPNADLVIKNSSDDFSVFTVSSTGKKVYFSKANLTWNPTYGYHFHATQFDEEHSGGSSVLNFDYSNLPAHGDQQQTSLTGLDRFTWGHIPNQSINSSYYITNQQLSAGLNPEWGKQMTGEGNNQWRTLTADEWNYLLHKRSGNRFMTVSVLIPCTYKGEAAYTNISGLLLFPDNFDFSGLGLTEATGWLGRVNKVYAASSSYTPASGNYTVDDGIVTNYAHYINSGVYKLIEPSQDLEHLYTNSSSNMSKLLAAGCVFLPAVGCREGATYKKYYYYGNRNNPPQGFYWTSDRVTVGTQEKANYFWFGHVGGNAVETNPRPTFDADNTQYRDLGCCVRLVWDAN